MKRIIISAILLLSAFVAFGQNYAIAISQKNDDISRTLTIYKSDGSSFVLLERYAGAIHGFGMNQYGVWTMVNNVLYQNKEEKYRLTHDYSSVVMRVVGNTVVIAGSENRSFNSNGYEGRLFGYKYSNGSMKKVYETPWERKSLKMKNFRGFRGALGERMTECNYTDHKMIAGDKYEHGGETSKVFRVFDCDLDPDGNILATGWGERERTYMNGVRKYYIVNRCARVWKNGKNTILQYENKTSAAYNINAFPGGNKNILTSGHLHDCACAWSDNVDNAYSGDMGPVLREAVAPLAMNGNIPTSFMRVMLIGTKLYSVQHTSGSKSEYVPALISGIPSEVVFSDVVYCKDFFYAVGVNKNTMNVEVWKISKTGNAQKINEINCGSAWNTNYRIAAY